MLPFLYLFGPLVVLTLTFERPWYIAVPATVAAYIVVMVMAVTIGL